MFSITERQQSGRLRAGVLLVLGGVLAAAGLWTGWLALRPAAAAPAAAAPPPAGEPLDPPRPQEALVFVSGAVVSPGLYRLPVTARIADAVAAAGGLSDTADPGRLPDMASRVHDGRQVNVPFRRIAGSSAAAPALARRLDVNTATVDELAAVPGMPAGLPEAIVSSREEWGPLHTLSELTSLLGVDAATVRALRPYLRVVAPP